MPASTSSKSLSITNPLVLYRSLLTTKRIDPDPSQHRLALYFQVLYDRLRDYEPVAQYGFRLQQLHQTLGSTPANPAPGTNHDTPRQSILAGIFEKKSKDTSKENLALTTVLTSAEAAKEIDSPKGLLLHGEVGTGKSMLVDLFAECLPTRKKRRWHYNTFMLDIFAKMERIRRSRELIIPTSLGQQDEYSLLWLARDMISTSPILFLDEFQLPDRAAAKILTNLMNCFFQLGGVLVATSNRMPEELDKAAGMHFTPPKSSGGFRRLGWRDQSLRPQTNRSEFAEFLDVLRARCDVWQMDSNKDYRRGEAISKGVTSSQNQASNNHNLASSSGFEPTSKENRGRGWEQSASSRSQAHGDNSSLSSSSEAKQNIHPNFYYTSDVKSPLEVVPTMLGFSSTFSVPWISQTLQVYSRSLIVPRTYKGVACFTFAEICSTARGPSTALGPADYITLASHFHTFIVTDVPVLSLLQKNEARRFITLLDALYEARCKLSIFAEAGPDETFFPEVIKSSQLSAQPQNETVSDDVTYSETLSEIYQDASAPFRPNISPYGDQNPSTVPPDEADVTHSRFAGLFDDNRTERQHELSKLQERSTVDVGNARLLDGSSFLRSASDTTANMLADTESDASAPNTRRAEPDFSVGGAFTGEDEKFAFKRARSRLWELCSARWWARRHVPSEDGNDEKVDPELKPSWWQPVSEEIRAWERPISQSHLGIPYGFGERPLGGSNAYEGKGTANSIQEDADSVLFKHGSTSPFRSIAEPPPKFSWTHVWGMMRWGKRAGRWGQGPSAFNRYTPRDDKAQKNEGSSDYVRRRNAWRAQDNKPPGGSEAR